MSTSETVKFDICPCPCGEGQIVKYITTQDNPWSGADVHQEIECGKCKSEWSLSYNTLTLISSKASYIEVMHRMYELEKHISAIADGVFQRTFEQIKDRTKKSQILYFSECGLTGMNYRQYLKHISDGNPPWTVCRWPRNIEWLLENCTPTERTTIVDLLDMHKAIEQDRKAAAEKIVTRSVA